MLRAQRKSVLNLSASAVLMSLGWWSFCNSFFFLAITQEQAWFWHKLASIGWCGFVVLTAYYFLALTNQRQKIMSWWKKTLFFAPAFLLICKNLLGETTSLAQEMVQSTKGWGWIYENTVTSLWLWLYLLYVAVYFGMAFYFLYQWAKSTKHKMKQEMAIWFIILDTITIFCGLVTDVILPLTNPVFPPLANIATALFGLGYFTIIYRHDLFNINLLISSEDILQISNNAIFVIDENKEILRCNRAGEILLGYHKKQLLGANFRELTGVKMDFQSLYAQGDLIDTEAKLSCQDGTVKDVLLSAAVAKDKRKSFLCIIVSCQDVSKQMKVQEELAQERENYKKLAKDYQRLAYFDPLTGLPNRRYFLDALSDFEAGYLIEQRDFAVIFLDLDNFKHINDVYGHKVGDELLTAAANRLQSCMAKEELVARLGGDEFTILMPCLEADAVARKLQRIEQQFHQRILVEGKLHTLGISAGHGIFSEVGDGTKLMQKADQAMYRNKKFQFQENLKS